MFATNQTPNQNFAEVLAPVITLLAIACELVVSNLRGIHPAPYFVKTGILKFWRGKQSVSDTAAMLGILCGLRIVFCWAEVTARSNAQVRRHLSLPSNIDKFTASNVVDDSAGEMSGRMGRMLKHQPSAFELYRSIRSAADSEHMQCAGAVVLALQPVALLVNAAQFGRLARAQM